MAIMQTKNVAVVFLIMLNGINIHQLTGVLWLFNFLLAN